MYERAALQGHADAMFNLAMCYRNGRGVPEDGSMMVSLCRRAASFGCHAAFKGLAFAYRWGIAVPASPEMAAYYYRLARAYPNYLSTFYTQSTTPATDK